MSRQLQEKEKNKPVAAKAKQRHLDAQMSDASRPDLEAHEACVFACMRMAVGRPLPGDLAEFNGAAVRVIEMHSDRFVSVQALDPSSPVQRALARDLRLVHPGGRASHMRETHHSAQVLSRTQRYTIDANGGHSKDDAGVAVRAEWQQYHLLRYGCSDVVGAGARPVRLIIEARGEDQVHSGRIDIPAK